MGNINNRYLVKNITNFADKGYIYYELHPECYCFLKVDNPDFKEFRSMLVKDKFFHINIVDNIITKVELSDKQFTEKTLKVYGVKFQYEYCIIVDDYDCENSDYDDEIDYTYKAPSTLFPDPSAVIGKSITIKGTPDKSGKEFLISSWKFY